METRIPMDTHYSERLSARESNEPSGSLLERWGNSTIRRFEDGRMASVGNVDDTGKILEREPLLLREWAKLHAHELLEIAGS
jgi:hypothetical protein